MSERLILASSSQYRRQLLGRLGLHFETQSPNVDEAAQPGEEAASLARRLARAKANKVGESAAPGSIVIGSDQAANLEGRLLRKPGDMATALEQLLACQGKSVSFHTACVVVDRESGRAIEGVDHTSVNFLKLDTPRLERYLEIEQPFDCAGGFKAEGLGVTLFSSIDSRDPTALLGLPLIWLSGVLRELGVDPLARPSDA